MREMSSVQAAEDAAQAVLLVLASNGPKLRRDVVLPTWLYGVCRLTCRNLKRQQRRESVRMEKAAVQMEQGQRESAGWEEICPHLHDSLDALSSRDRDLIVLRFFDEMSHREIGDALRISEEAARVGVSRAVDRLRRKLAVAGVVAGVAVLVDLLAERSAEAIPAHTVSHLAASGLSAISPDRAGAAYHLAQGVIRSMKVTQLKLAAAVSVGLITASSAVIAVTYHNASQRDPKAVAEYQSAIAAYSKLQSYSDVEIGSGGGAGALGVPDRLVLHFRRPGQYAIEATRYNQTHRTTSDGTYVYTSSVPESGTYIRESATQKSVFPAVFQSAGVANNGPSDLLANAFEPKPAPPPLSTRITSATFGPEETLDGTRCDTVRFGYGNGPESYWFEFAIGQSDHLIRRQHEHQAASGQYGAMDATILYTNVRFNQSIPASTFAFNPPPGSIKQDIGITHDAKAQSIIQSMYDRYNKMASYHCREVMTWQPTAAPTPWAMGTAVYTVRHQRNVVFDISDAKPAVSKVHVVVDNGHAYAVGTGPRWSAAEYMDSSVRMRDETVNFARNAVANTAGVQDDWMPSMAVGWDMRPSTGDYGFTVEQQTQTIDGMAMDVIFEPRRVLPAPGQRPESADAGEYLYIGHDDHLLHRLIMRNQDGVTICNYDSIAVDEEIPASEFDFQIPPGRKPVDSLISLLH